jgi:hypothetical protein
MVGAGSASFSTENWRNDVFFHEEVTVTLKVWIALLASKAEGIPTEDRPYVKSCERLAAN